MRIQPVYFSATGTTKKVVKNMATSLANLLDGELLSPVDFTPKSAREKQSTWTERDIVVVGVPVYAGRVPNVLLPYLNTWEGRGARAVCVVLYGNRNYDDALIELKDLLENRGFEVVAACAFVGEHSFSKVLAAGRPDEEDIAVARKFAEEITMKLKSRGNDEKTDGQEGDGSVAVKGEIPYRRHYMPKDENGNPVDIRKVTPKTNQDCLDCKLCADICPMGSIDRDNTSQLNGICIKCGACLKKCPAGAKYYDNADYLRHQHELEVQFCERKEPELFLV